MGLLTSEEYVKSILPLNDNIDYKLIKLHLSEAQDKFIIPLLGTAYYVDLITRYEDQTLTAIEISDLVPAVKKIIAYKAFSRALIAININVANNGVTTRVGSYFDGSNKMKEINLLCNEYLADAEHYEKLAVDILHKYPSSFPLYKNTNSNLINPQPNTQRQDFGVIFI